MPKSDGKHFVYLATATLALGGMLFGYDIGVISGAILFIKKEFNAVVSNPLVQKTRQVKSKHAMSALGTSRHSLHCGHCGRYRGHSGQTAVRSLDC